jgi:hypothetical protein
VTEDDIAKKLLLEENAFLRRKVEELQATVKGFDWHERDLQRLKDAVRPVHGDVWDIQAAINDVNELAAIGKLLQPEGRRSSNAFLVEHLIADRNRFKAMAALELLDEVLRRSAAGAEEK